MPLNNDQPAAFGEREIANLLGAWGKADTPANRGLLSAEAKKFTDDPDWGPHTWERFFQYADVRRLKRLLANKAGAVLRGDDGGDSDYTVIEGWAPPQPKMPAPPERKTEPPPPPKPTPSFIFEPKPTPPPQPKEPAAVFSAAKQPPPSKPEPAPPPKKPETVFSGTAQTPPPRDKHEPPPLFKPAPPPPPPAPEKTRTTEYTQTVSTSTGPLEAPAGESAGTKRRKIVPLVLVILGLLAAALIVFVLLFARPVPERTASPQAPVSAEPAASPAQAETAAERFIRAVGENSPVMFIADQEFFLPGEERKLDNILAAAKEISKADLLVTGHTADNNMPEAQFVLSLERAQTVKAYLLKNPAGSVLTIEVKGKGATEPVVTGVPPGKQEANRRAEIKVKSAE
jgi:outer membrane protein OmpA-like peptidoglycan-associated protein